MLYLNPTFIISRVIRLYEDSTLSENWAIIEERIRIVKGLTFNLAVNPDNPERIRQDKALTLNLADSSQSAKIPRVRG